MVSSTRGIKRGTVTTRKKTGSKLRPRVQSTAGRTSGKANLKTGNRRRKVVRSRRANLR